MDTQTPPLSDSSDNPSSPRQLLVLDVPDPGPAAVPFRNSGKLLSLLADAQTKVLWIQGNAGIGRSTFIQSALHEHAKSRKELLGVLRVECWPGLRMEELLFLLSEFFCQIGCNELAELILQRTALTSKIRVFLQLIQRLPVCIWLDDFEQLAGDPRCSGSATLKQFIKMWKLLEGGSGKLLLATQESAQSDAFGDFPHLSTLVLKQEDLMDLKEYWKRCQEILPEGSILPPFARIPPDLRRTLLSLKIFQGSRLLIHEPDSPSTLEDLLSRLREAIAAPLKTTMDVLATYHRPMSQGALRAVLESSQPAEFEKAENYKLDELRRLGLLASSTHDQRLKLHPVVQKCWLELIKTGDPPAKTRCHFEIAKQHLETAMQTQSLWEWYWAFVHLMEAGNIKEAYEIHKSFVEVFLCAGFLEIAKAVLEECLNKIDGPQREVVIGNLAIIYKTEGNHQGALKLYKDALHHFARRNDLPNVARVHHQIGNTYYLQGNFPKALSHYRSSFEIATHLGDSVVALMTRVQIANIQFSNREFDQALEAYTEAMKLATSTANPLMELALHIQISQIYLSQNLIPEAGQELQLAQELALKHDDRRNFLKILQLKGIVAGKCRDYVEAIEHFNKAGETALGLGDLSEQANCQLHLGALEEEQLHYAEAIRAYFRARDLLQSGIERHGDESGETGAAQADLDAVQMRIQEVADKVGPETFQRILKNLGR